MCRLTISFTLGTLHSAAVGVVPYDMIFKVLNLLDKQELRNAIVESTILLTAKNNKMLGAMPVSGICVDEKV